MDRWIFGLENEYGVTCTLRGQRRLNPDEVPRYLFRRVVSWGRSSNVFLENGARLYLDVGSHPEYATPECDSIYDLVVHDKAGERILEQLLQFAEQRLREEGIRGVIYLFKNNTDSAGNSYGCHENYLTILRDMTLENPIRAIREISHDITCKKRVRLANGREVTALDIQSEYLNRALRYAETKGLSPLEEQALAMWEHCLTALGKDPLSLDRECDWVIKHN